MDHLKQRQQIINRSHWYFLNGVVHFNNSIVVNLMNMAIFFLIDFRHRTHQYTYTLIHYRSKCRVCWSSTKLHIPCIRQANLSVKPSPVILIAQFCIELNIYSNLFIQHAQTQWERKKTAPQLPPIAIEVLHFEANHDGLCASIQYIVDIEI